MPVLTLSFLLECSEIIIGAAAIRYSPVGNGLCYGLGGSAVEVSKDGMQCSFELNFLLEPNFLTQQSLSLRQGRLISMVGINCELTLLVAPP